MVTKLHFTKLGVPVALILAIAWGLPAPIMEASTPQVGANGPTEVPGGMVAGVPPQEGHFPFNPPLEGQGSQGSYRSISDYERAAIAKSVPIQRRQSDDGLVSTEPIGDPSPSDGSDQSSPSSFSFKNFGDYLVGKNGELSESAENAAKNIANIQNMDDPGEASTADSKMNPSINQKDPDGTSPPKEAQIPPEHTQQNYDRERELQAYRVQHPSNFFDGWNAHMAQSNAGAPSTAGRVGSGGFYREAGKRLWNWGSDLWGGLNNLIRNA
ncbi:hypothetical protein BDV33DRAFT_210883 [Aspergillus novoparasiticus]|uniref:Secreted protein n=1 Tax=Aspergillus novoparasiticus TaxID=986946 RepID=A0A5N6E5W8_9EURO|nr:hypothetical protein BDV33DRAFT_210883 [Aspergillus novoparasiticus]